MKVLFITSLLRGGGAETFLYELVKGLSRFKDIDISIISGSSTGISDYISANAKMRIHIVPNTRFYFQEWLLGLGNPVIEKRIKRIIKSERPDIIHLNNFLGLGPAVINACNGIEVPVVTTIHDYWPKCPKTTLVYAGKNKIESPCSDTHRCLETDCVRFLKVLPQPTHLIKLRYGSFKKKVLEFLRSSTVIAVSNHTKNMLEKHGLNNVRVIYNGRTLKKINFSYETWRQRNYILYLGGSRFEKGFHVMFNLLNNIARDQEIKELFSPFIFVVRSERLGINYTDLKLEISSYFHDVEEYFKRSLVTLIPSVYQEPLPYTAIEAISYGSLVLAFKTGGLQEVISDDFFLVKPYDVEAFRERLIEIIRSDRESLYRRLETIRNHVVTTFNADRMVKDYYNLYIELAK